MISNLLNPLNAWGLFAPQFDIAVDVIEFNFKLMIDVHNRHSMYNRCTKQENMHNRHIKNEVRHMTRVLKLLRMKIHMTGILGNGFGSRSIKTLK